MNKAEKARLKSYNFVSKEDYIFYLRELIVEVQICYARMKMYLDEVKLIIEGAKNKFEGENIDSITIDFDVFHRCNDSIRGIGLRVANLIGDEQKCSMSYKRFIKIAKKNGISLSDNKDNEIDSLLEKMRNFRNWINHEPESSINSKIELLKTGKYEHPKKNPITINEYDKCKLEWLIDLYNQSCEFNKAARIIHQSMKKDYSSLIGESVRISHEQVFDTNLDIHSIALKSSEIQGLV